jgi:hypothetical protein
MKNSQSTYKRIKVNWWIVILLGGTYVLCIFAYICQWGDRPIEHVADLLKIGLILLAVLVFAGRFKVIVNDDYAIFRSDVWVPIKIPVSMINSVSVKKAAATGMNFPGSKVKYYQFDFVNQAVSINLKSGKTYKITIKDAEKIKEEIEKRMLIPNK